MQVELLLLNALKSRQMKLQEVPYSSSVANRYLAQNLQFKSSC